MRQSEHGYRSTSGPVRVGLVWPNSYASAMGSLGFIWLWQSLAIKGVTASHRYLGESPFFRMDTPPVSLEAQLPLQECDLLAVSISYELDVITFIQMLYSAGIPPLASNRTEHDPLVIGGGPLTRSNPELLRPFCDLTIIGDGERALSTLSSRMDTAVTRDAIVEPLSSLPEVATPDRSAPGLFHAPVSTMPVVARGWAEHGAFGPVSLVEVSRGCPKKCTFCIGRSDNAPLRLAPADQVIAAVPAQSPGLGIIGAAAGFYPDMKQLLQWAAEAGKSAGVSSLRADRLDPELLGLLVRTGTTVLTVAADGASQRIRDEIGKDVTTEHLVEAAHLAREAGMNAMKLYMMLGYPGEQAPDIEELATLANRLNRVLPLVLSTAIFVPKRTTPLGESLFVPLKTINSHVKFLRKRLSGGIRVARVSPREAQIQHLLSHLAAEQAERLVRVALTGAHYSDWKQEFDL